MVKIEKLNKIMLDLRKICEFYMKKYKYIYTVVNMVYDSSRMQKFALIQTKSKKIFKIL